MQELLTKLDKRIEDYKASLDMENYSKSLGSLYNTLLKFYPAKTKELERELKLDELMKTWISLTEDVLSKSAFVINHESLTFNLGKESFDFYDLNYILEEQKIPKEYHNFVRSWLSEPHIFAQAQVVSFVKDF